MIDEIDRQILNELQSDARISNAELARRVGMAPSGVLERVRKLEERGIVRGYEARLDAKRLGWGLVAFTYVRSDDPVGGIGTAQALSEIPEVQEVHHIAGEDCYLIKIRVSDVEALGRLLRERIGVIPAIRSTRTTIVMETLKETARVLVPGSREMEGD
jgi:Lrp/AsnC family leucine-responsive transcriptional regulator